MKIKRTDGGIKPLQIKLIISFMLGIIVSSITVYSAANIIASKKISYNNAQSNLQASNVQDAIDELYNHATNYETLKADMLNIFYPVGSIYISTSLSTTSQVASKLGGTWQVFGEGRTLISANSTYPINTTGGSVSESYTPAGTNTGGSVQNHTLTVAEMPAHQHNMYYNFTGASSIGGNWKISMINSTYGSSGNWPNHTGLSTNVGMTGGGGAHNHGFTNPTFTGTAATISHMQPYITVYMYKRTA